jgi:para-aminobenzoate synthetase
MELSIVVRSIVLEVGTATLGAGGAITVLSHPEAKYEEMLKARPLLELPDAPPSRTPATGQ